jgi:hypothetical protein
VIIYLINQDLIKKALLQRALLQTAKAGNLQLMAELIAYGADVFAPDENNKCALTYIAKSTLHETCTVLQELEKLLVNLAEKYSSNAVTAEAKLKTIH